LRWRWKACVSSHFEELWNNGRVERIDEFYSPDFVKFGLQYSDARTVIQTIIECFYNSNTSQSGLGEIRLHSERFTGNSGFLR
jgi:hypothetical protein